jgi:endonuclease YncB( thermonuclease family)
MRALAIALIVVPFAAQAEEAACPFPKSAAFQSLSAVIDGRSVLLADGREIRLAGIEVPFASRPGQASSAPALASKNALEALLAGRRIALHPAEPATDRYGRLVAYAFREGETVPLQVAMLAAGRARLSGEAGPCRAALLAAEKFAREAGLGLWGEPPTALQRAEDGAALVTGRGKFAVAEGKVLSVRRSGGTIYVNFGRRWRDSLTVTMSRARERSFATAGFEPEKLAGRVVRVRGYVEDRNGPVIEAVRPEQLEMLER